MTQHFQRSQGRRITNFFISSSLDWTLGALCVPPTDVARLSDEYPDSECSLNEEALPITLRYASSRTAHNW